MNTPSPSQTPPFGTDHTAAVRHSFDISARNYDAERRGLIPCFDDFYGTAVGLVHPERTARLRILDLGAGTGLFSRMLLDCYTEARLTLVDYSAPMLARARENFAGHPRVRIVEGDYSHPDFSPPDTGYDAVVSALSIHHLDDAGKRAVYARAYQWLRPGGRFINADQALGGGALLEALCQEDWSARVEASGLPESAIAASRERRKLDRTAGMVDQLDWLRAAGFAECDVLYRSFTFTVFTGIKA